MAFTYREGLGRPLSWQEMDDNLEHVEELAGEAEAASEEARSAASTAVGAAHFLGRWSELSGPATVPSAVQHDGGFWQLLTDIPSIAASEPGVSSDWSEVEQFEFPPSGIPTSTGAAWGTSKTIPSGDIIGTNDTQSLTNKTFGTGTKEAVSTGTTLIINEASAPFQQVTLSGNVTATVNLPLGVSRTVWVNPGTYSITWPGATWKVGDVDDLPDGKWSCLTLTGRPGSTAGMVALVGSEP